MSDREREGYILIDRNILDWKWWKNHNTLIVFLWLLLKAQFHESHWGGVQINRGQVATSMKNIESDNQLSRQQVRTAISNLKSTGEITITRHSKFLVFTIANYDKYQSLTIKPTKKQQSNNHQITINQPHTNTYNTYNTDKRRNKGSLRSDLPEQIEDIIPERDLAGFPSFEDMPCIADGTKRDIPPRVRHLFGSQYDAYWRYMEKCSMS